MRIKTVSLSTKINFPKDWTEFYPSNEQHEECTKINSNLTTKQSNYYISLCFFSNENTKGSVYLNTQNKTIKFLIDTTTFNNCGNNGDGCFIFYQQEDEFVQDRVCSFACKVNTQYTKGVYCKIDVSDNSSHKNFINSSSISKSEVESFEELIKFLAVLIVSCNF